MLRLYGVDAITDAQVVEITNEGVVLDRQGSVEKIACDTVVAAVGTYASNDLEGMIRDNAERVVVVGDAKSPRKAYEAIREGFDAARGIEGETII